MGQKREEKKISGKKTSDSTCLNIDWHRRTAGKTVNSLAWIKEWKLHKGNRISLGWTEIIKSLECRAKESNVIL